MRLLCAILALINPFWRQDPGIGRNIRRSRNDAVVRDGLPRLPECRWTGPNRACV